MSWGGRPTSGPSWKPARCECGARHPAFNRDGGKPGTPWRCRKCDAIAEPLPVADPFAGGAPADDRQASLL